MYRAAVEFCDLQDNNRLYKAGEQYPRPGLSVSDALIKAVEQPLKATKEQPKEIPAHGAETPKKACRGRQKG